MNGWMDDLVANVGFAIAIAIGIAVTGCGKTGKACALAYIRDQMPGLVYWTKIHLKCGKMKIEREKKKEIDREKNDWIDAGAMS